MLECRLAAAGAAAEAPPRDRGAGGESSIARELRINEQIQVPRVRVIRGEDQIGILPLGEALQVAVDADLDLVEVAPTADPPVCRIMDYGRFKYEQRKRERESRRSSRHVELREVRMKVKIGQHDLDFKARTASKLLGAGDKVKVSVMFRAREITHPEIGEQLLRRFYERVSEQATIERQPTMEGRVMSMTLDPVRRRTDGTQQGSSAEVAAAT